MTLKDLIEKSEKLHFNFVKDYRLFKDFKDTFMKETYISLEKRKSILKQIKSRLKK